MLSIQETPEVQEIIPDTLNVNITTEKTQLELNDKTPVILTEEMIQENTEDVAQTALQEIIEQNNSNAYQSQNNLINKEENTHNDFTNEAKESLEKINNLEVPEINLVNNSLQELDINLDDLPITNSFQIKERNNIYYDMYREAKRKAKTARDLALSSLLEAKRIKNTYLLNDISDSEESEESDLENE